MSLRYTDDMPKGLEIQKLSYRVWKCDSRSWAIASTFFSKRDRIAWPSGLRRWFKAPVTSVAWVRIPPLSNCIETRWQQWYILLIACIDDSVVQWCKATVSILSVCIEFQKNNSLQFESHRLFYYKWDGSMAQWSKALATDTKHLDGVGSNPTSANLY